MDNFRSLANHYKRALPEYKISIRRVRVKDPDHALCWKKADGSFQIHIDSRLDLRAQVLLLPHEMAHVLSWEKDNHRSEHGPQFGIAYSKTWQMYVSWTEL